MKAKTYRNIPGSTILNFAPPTLRDKVALRRFDKDGLYTLLAFRSQRQDTVLSGAVRHALAGLPPDERLVVFGGCFTLEAIALLKERGAEIFAQSEYPWTDESWSNRG
jgi:hypothetical protein